MSDYFDSIPDEQFDPAEHDPNYQRSFAPPDDGTYLAHVKLQVRRDRKGEPVTPENVFGTPDQIASKGGKWLANLVAVIEDGPRKGSYLFDSVGTYDMKVPGDSGKTTTSANLALNALGLRDQAKAAGTAGLAKLLWGAIGADGAKMYVRSSWRADCVDCSRAGVKPNSVRGQKSKKKGTQAFNFPLVGEKHDPDTQCPSCGQTITARFAGFEIQRGVK